MQKDLQRRLNNDFWFLLYFTDVEMLQNLALFIWMPWALAWACLVYKLHFKLAAFPKQKVCMINLPHYAR